MTHPFVPSEFSSIRVTIAVIGRFAANCSYTILNLYSAELFPTVIRGNFCRINPNLIDFKNHLEASSRDKSYTKLHQHQLTPFQNIFVKFQPNKK